jgi:hypothetical protein
VTSRTATASASASSVGRSAWSPAEQRLQHALGDQLGRQGVGGDRVEHRDVGPQALAGDQPLALGVFQAGHRAELGAGAQGRGDRDESYGALGALRQHGHAAALRDREPGSRGGALVQQGEQFGLVEQGAAADADDQLDPPQTSGQVQDAGQGAGAGQDGQLRLAAGLDDLAADAGDDLALQHAGIDEQAHPPPGARGQPRGQAVGPEERTGQALRALLCHAGTSLPL